MHIEISTQTRNPIRLSQMVECLALCFCDPQILGSSQDEDGMVSRNGNLKSM